MIVLSLFDGMSCGRIALERAEIKVNKYYASEIDKYTIQISEKNYPNIIKLGDVAKWKEWDIDWSSIDLLIGGSPCQGFSFAGKQLAFDDPRSKLFFIFVDILNHIKKVNPNIKFMLENVRMKQEYLDVISKALGVQPVKINSSLVSAQNRVRYYWCNWEVTQPEDKGILLEDIIECGVVDRDKSYCIDANYFKGGNLKSYFEKHRRQLVFEKPFIVAQRGRSIVDGKRKDFKGAPTTQRLEPRIDNKTNCLTTVQKDNYVLENYSIRKLTPIECERLQNLPDNYTEGVSNTQRYKMLGNGWTVDIIKHIFKELFNGRKQNS